MKTKFILPIIIVCILFLWYGRANYSFDYNPNIDNHAQRINEYLIKNPQNESLMIKAFAKKFTTYSEEKRQEIIYYRQLLSKVHRRKYISCLSKKLDPNDSMYWQNSKDQKELLKYANDKRYLIKSQFCTLDSSTTVSCSNVVFDTTKYPQWNIYKDNLINLWTTSIVDINVNEIPDRYSFVASYDMFCQKQNTWSLFAEDTLIHNIGKLVDIVKLMKDNKWWQVDWAIFLPKWNFISEYIGERVYRNGKLVFALEGQDPLDLRLYYITYINNKISLKRASQPIVGIRGGVGKKDEVGLYNFADKPILQDEFGEYYDINKNNPIMIIKSDNMYAIDKEMKVYMLWILNWKIQNKAFDKALKDLLK